METEYAVVVIKPDAVRDCLELILLKEIREGAGVDVAFQKYWPFSAWQVDLIYPEWLQRPEFPAMKRNLTMGPSLFAVVCGKPGAYARLKAVKGKMNAGGLRLKYRTRSIEEWKLLGLSGEALRDKVAENRLHTSDGPDDTALLCSLAMRPQEIEEADVRFPSLARAIRRRMSLQRL